MHSAPTNDSKVLAKDATAVTLDRLWRSFHQTKLLLKACDLRRVNRGALILDGFRRGRQSAVRQGGRLGAGSYPCLCGALGTPHSGASPEVAQIKPCCPGRQGTLVELVSASPCILSRQQVGVDHSVVSPTHPPPILKPAFHTVLPSYQQVPRLCSRTRVAAKLCALCHRFNCSPSSISSERHCAECHW
jgi:hypothetical protein